MNDPKRAASCRSNHQHFGHRAGRRLLASGQRYTTASTALRPGNEYERRFSSEMATAAHQATAAHPCEESVAGWSSITSSNATMAVRITYRICARCARPVTTVDMPGGGGGSKSLRVLGARPAGGNALISAKFRNFFCSPTGGRGGGGMNRNQTNVDL
jgi:hypothetical protein